MAAQGRVYKRCGCVDPRTGRPYGKGCPHLTKPGHGSWYITFELPPGSDGMRRRLRHGGYRTRALAERALADLRRPTAADPTRLLLTTGQWLDYWLATRLRPRQSTLRGYATHVRRDITPHIGRILLRELSLDDLQLLFAILARTPTRYGRVRAPSSLHRIRATLRVALNAAVRRGLIDSNPGQFVELPPADRPKAIVWTEARVALWRATGEHPVVSVWTAAQTAEFLDYVHDHPLYLMFRLIALVGLRRGEACGLRWCDVDLDRRMLIISNQLQHQDKSLVLCPPKTRHSSRLVALDHATAALLRRYRTARLAEATHRAGSCSPTPGAARSRRTSCPVCSCCCHAGPVCHRFGCTTCGTGPQRYHWPPATTSRWCRRCSGTPASY